MGIQDFDHWPGPSVSDEEYQRHQWIPIGIGELKWRGVEPLGGIADELKNFADMTSKEFSISFPMQAGKTAFIEELIGKTPLPPVPPELLPEPLLPVRSASDPTPGKRLAGRSHHGPRRGSAYDARGMRRW